MSVHVSTDQLWPATSLDGGDGVSVGVIVGTGVGIAVIAVLVVLSLCWYCKNRSEYEVGGNPEDGLEETVDGEIDMPSLGASGADQSGQNTDPDDENMSQPETDRHAPENRMNGRSSRNQQGLL